MRDRSTSSNKNPPKRPKREDVADGGNIFSLVKNLAIRVTYPTGVARFPAKRPGETICMAGRVLGSVQRSALILQSLARRNIESSSKPFDLFSIARLRLPCEQAW